jgi:hypothetical protein
MNDANVPLYVLGLTKHNRYYKSHKELMKEKAHRRYYLKVHGISEPPPRRPNLKVPTQHPSS